MIQSAHAGKKLWKRKRIRSTRRLKGKGSSGTMALRSTTTSLSEFGLLLTELVRHWKSESIGIPTQGSTSWKTWIEDLHSMAQLSNVQVTSEQVEVLLNAKLKLVDYTDGGTEYAKSILGSSWKGLVEQ